MRVPLVLVVLLVAGCASPGNDPGGGDGGAAPVAADWAARAVPSGEAHDHDDPAQHANLSTPNFQVLGWDPLVTQALGTTAGGHYCGGVGATGEGRRLAVVHSFDSTTNVAFVLVDVTDPAAPMKLGEFLLDNVHIYDSTISPDGRFVVLGANPEVPAFPLLAGGLLRVQPQWRDACTGAVRPAGPEQALPLAPGVILVDVRTPESPTFADFAPTPVLGPHSVHAADIEGAPLFLASITNLEHQASYFQFYGVEELPIAGPRLVHHSTYQGPPGPRDPSVPLINGHVDGYVAKHPGTGQTLAWLANWDAGVIVLDVTNPRVPTEIGRWGGANPSRGPATLGDDAMGGIHGTYPLPVLWGDKHYTLAGQELGGRPDDRPTGWIFILDTTDPANPTEVGRWTLPVDVEWGAFLQFSTHYFVVVERTLFVSLYHGGVWAIDLSDDANLTDPPTIGVWIPDRVSPDPPAGEGYDEVLDVVSLGGYDLLSFGSRSGAYTLRFDPTMPMPAPAPWPRDG